MKNKNVLIAVIGGIVACLVCAGIIFLYPKSENNLKGNQTQTGYEEEIILGDTGYCSPQSAVPSSVCSGLSQSACDANSACYWVDTTPSATATATTTPTASTSSGTSCSSSPCCINGTTSYVESVCRDAAIPKTCGACPTTSPTATPSTTCIQLSDNAKRCTSVTVSGTTCTGNNYPDWASCRSHITCGSNEYINSTSCQACTTGTHPKSANCVGLQTTCCEADATPTATTTTPTPTATAQSCSSSPCCVNGVTTNVDSVCRDAAIPKTCGACPTTSPTATATTTPTPTATANASTCASCMAQCQGTDEYCAGICADDCPTSTPTATATATPTCESYDGVANCPSWCYTWGDGECHTNPKPTTNPSASPVTDWTKIEGPCCVTTNGVSSTIEATYGCQQAVAAHQTVTEGRCPVPAIQKVTRVSASYSGTIYLTPEDLNGAGYKQVVYVAYDQSGNVIPGNKLTWSVNGGNGVVVTSSSNAGGFSVTYRGIECDKPSQTVYVRASGSGDITGSATSPSITIAADSIRYKKWTQSNYNKKNTNNYPLLSEAYATNSCYAVSGYDEATQKYAYIHNRCCGSSTPSSVTYDYCCAKTDGSDFSWRSGQSNRSCPSGYTIDETKNANTCKTVRIPACYTDSDNGFHWTDDPEPSWIKVAGITSETDCKKDETPACYKDTNGEYKWGLYAKSDGYTLITAVDTEEKCNNQGACYKNNFNDYTWDTEAPKECISKNSCWVPKTDPTVGSTCKYTSQNACENVEGYKVVEGVTKPENCVSPENPACYVHGQEFVWGKYNNVKGYIKLDDILAEEYCKVPTEEACYKDPDGNYVWGEFSNTTGYKLVPSVTSLNQCNNDVPTPSTGLDVSKVVYVFMAILMAFGIGFIYYSSIMKKQNQ